MVATAVSNGSTATGDALLGVDTEEDKAAKEKRQEELMKKEFKRVSVQVFDLLSHGVDEQILTARDRADYMEGISERNLEIGGASTWEIKIQWLEESLRKFAPKFVNEAREMTSTFLGDIARAEKKGWITSDSARRWYARLHERSADWEETKGFLKRFNAEYMANWEKLATKKERALTKVAKLGLTSATIPLLAEFQEEDFDDKHFRERSTTIDTLLAEIAVYEKDQDKITNLFTKAKAMLSNEVRLKVMRPDQAAEWLESLFNRDRSSDEIAGILKGTLAEYIGNWAKVRYRYDRVFRRMEKGIPPGTQRLEEKEFMNLSYPEKQSYVQEAEYALDLVDKGFSNKPVDKMKMEIRSLMAQKDWQAAQELIDEARIIAIGEDVYELDSMENYIRLYADDDEVEENSNESAAEILDDIREILGDVPASVQMLYTRALSAGPQVFASLCTYIYNYIWCVDNGYMDNDRREELMQESYQDTEDIIENGHRPDGLETINLDIIDEQDKSKAMRPYEKTWAPTVILMDAQNASSCGILLNELRGKQEARDYWSTLIIKNISQAKQRELVVGVNHRLKSSIRKLHKKGFGFSSVGPPVSLN